MPFEPSGVGCACLAGTPEYEPGCGIPVDTTNGGCNSVPVVTSPLALNATVCGTAGYDGGSGTRDTDWYEIVITEAGTYTWSVAPEFPAAIFVLDTVCLPATLGADSSTGCGDVATITVPLVPGTYRFFVAPEFMDPFACGRGYTARLTGPPAGAWSGTSAFGTDVYGAAATSDGSYVYAGGGYSFSGGGNSTQFARWNPVTGVWTPRATLPIAAEMSSLVYGHNGKIYLFGGYPNGGAVSSSTYVYDIALNSWSGGPAMPAPRQQMASGYHANYIYLAGGYPDGTVSTPNPALWAFHVPTGTWNTTLDPLPADFGGAGGAVIDGKFLVAGGRDLADVDRDTLYVYDIAAGDWSSGPSLPVGTNVPGSAATEDGELWVYGGGNPFLWNPGDRSAHVPSTTGGCQRYSSLSGWSDCPDLAGVRSFTASAVIGGRLIAVGGYNGSTSITTSETFTVSAIFIDGFESGFTDEWTGTIP